MLDTTEEKTQWNQSSNLFNELRLKMNKELEGQNFEYDISGNWGVQILKMEIMNSSEPKVKKLIDFFGTEIDSYSVWDYMIKKSPIENWSVQSSGRNWVLSDSGNYECVMEFNGFPIGLEEQLLETKWFEGVDVDFYFDTRRKLGHTSYKWVDDETNPNKFWGRKHVQRVRHFTSKKYFKDHIYDIHLDGYKIFRDFIQHPEMFSHLDFNEGYFHSEKNSYQTDYLEHDKIYKRENTNIQTLKHTPDYTVEEFDKSYSKLVELNTVIRPEFNEKNDDLCKYHNCIENWIRRLKDEEIRSQVYQKTGWKLI